MCCRITEESKRVPKAIAAGFGVKERNIWYCKRVIGKRLWAKESASECTCDDVEAV